MAGLRARQKADRNRRLLEAALQLFQTVGYDAARIEDIAEAAGVSVGTFYNYFQTKGDLLLATVTMEVETVLEAGEAILADPPRDVAQALEALIGCYYDHALVWLTKEMWRSAMALAIQAPDTPFSRRYTELDGRLRQQVCALLTGLQARGALRPDADCQALGEVIFNNLNMMFIEFVKDEPMPAATLRQIVRRQNLPLARMLAVTDAPK